MAGDWIKMRVNLRKHPKVIAMARHLANNREFMNWWSDPVQKTCDANVTEIVTFENVTRVTVCGLLEVWGSVNAVIKDNDHVEYMALIDLDDISGIPGFGEAMESVGWVVDDDGNGLIFSNFREFNTPESSRTKAKSDAERAREYRERKKAEAEKPEHHERHESSHREEKSREETFNPPVAPPKGRGKKPRTQIPEDFKPDDSLLTWAKENTPKPDPLAETRKFVDHHRSKGSVFADHRAAWRTWMHKAQEFAKDKKKPNGQAWGDHMMVDFDAVVREEREQERRKAQA